MKQTTIAVVMLMILTGCEEKLKVTDYQTSDNTCTVNVTPTKSTTTMYMEHMRRQDSIDRIPKLDHIIVSKNGDTQWVYKVK